MKLKYFCGYIVFALLSVQSGLAYADKVAYVDARRLIAEAPQGQVEAQALEKAFGDKNQEMKARIEQFQALEADFRKNSVLLSEQEQEQKKKELVDMQRALQRDQQTYGQEYARAREQGIGRLEKLISEEIFKIAKKNKIDLVVQQAVFASQAVDLTDMVLDELKKRHKK